MLALVRAGRSGLSVSDIQARTGMAASTLAHHLRFLASAGLIEQEKDGRSVINRAAFERLEALADLALGADRLTAGGSRAARSGQGFLPIGEIALRARAGTLPYIVIAVLLLAYLKAAGAEAMISQAFKGRETRMVVLAALFGGLAPFCSCQVIPLVAGLLALGTPLPAVMAFWLSSPLIDPSSILITAAALGWPMAIAKTLSAVGLGLFGGFALKGMMGAGFFKDALRAEVAPSGCCCKARTTIGAKPVWQFWREDARRTTFRTEMTSNGLFLFKWLALAHVLEGLLVTYVPAQTIVGATVFVTQS